MSLVSRYITLNGLCKIDSLFGNDHLFFEFDYRGEDRSTRCTVLKCHPAASQPIASLLYLQTKPINSSFMCAVCTVLVYHVMHGTCAHHRIKCSACARCINMCVSLYVCACVVCVVRVYVHVQAFMQLDPMIFIMPFDHIFVNLSSHLNSKSI